MIKVKIYRSVDGLVIGFDVKSHGDEIVCAAVSVLTLNTVNSIEQFTNDKFQCDYKKTGGMLRFRFSEDTCGKVSHDAVLLVNSLVYGLYGIKAQYGKEISIDEIKSGKEAVIIKDRRGKSQV